jgi:hypothetical protein
MNSAILSGTAPGVKKHGGQQYNFAIPAGKTITQPAFGTRAYLVVATAAVNMRCRGRDYGAGAFSIFAQGTGVGEPNAAEQFDVVDVQNFNAFAVVVSLWVGYADFIDNRLILDATINQAVTYPTQPTPTATNIPIPDISGSQFVDINGKAWIAISRVAIIISNVSTGTTLLLQQFGSVVANGPAVLASPPGLPIAHNSSGNFCLNVGGATIEAIVSEIYQAIPAT